MSDEPSNPKVAAEELCKPKCQEPWKTYLQCQDRIEGQNGKHCQGYYLDFWHCVDKCALPIYTKKITF
jgi:ubiquinol-cytochrome c reductase subunit 6